MGSLDKGGYHDTLPSKSKTLLQALYGEGGNADDAVIAGHLAAASMSAVEFPENADWVNSSPLSIHGNLKGRYVLLDFFTYCCINCMHILPALHKLEEHVPEGLVVVGVHSGKFSNEKSNDNILNAVSRYKITHPVINDQNYEMWNSYSIICWPTLVLINPSGKTVLISIGESDVEEVCRFVKDVVRLSPPTELQPVSLFQETDTDAGGLNSKKKTLSYPGKIFYHSDSNTLFISDTANNRVLQTNSSGEILHKYPSPESPTLNSPQGLLVYEEWVYVCDTNNHRVVRMELERGVLEVVCGTGNQGHDLQGGKVGPEQEISSPWDIELIPLQSVTGCHGNLLMIAMAGTHQIWGYALTDVSITHRGKNTEYKASTTWRLAGSGDEANKNNSYPHKASFAQPSGLSYDGSKFVYVADSESSTVRSVELPSFAVKNVAGGGLDPSDLFSYGDVDGKGTTAKLQHPIGITITGNHGNQTLLVADSYNHKIKQIQTKSRVVSTCSQITGLSEPSGLTHDPQSGCVYVADTNNHAVRVVKLGENSESWEVGVVDRARVSSSTGVSWVLTEEHTTSLTLSLSFTKHLNTSAPSIIKITHYTTHGRESHEVPVTDHVVQVPLVASGAADLAITLFTCSEEGACFMDKYIHRINFVDDTAERVLLKASDPLVINID
ncbi:NHL repeat-containing protein 2-like [Bolinopsis microptera]|uniref:NHL repeat-containing protein 2-like n=1 Tax=Bolinopsis microptera TaxID=2820187 RepID=UPI00307A334F